MWVRSGGAGKLRVVRAGEHPPTPGSEADADAGIAGVDALLKQKDGKSASG